MSPRPDVSEERKNQILEAAIAVFARFLQNYFKAYRDELARLVRRGVERGEFCAVDAKATAITIAALFEGLALLYFVDPQALQWAEQAETSMRLLLSGLQRPSSS